MGEYFPKRKKHQEDDIKSFIDRYSRVLQDSVSYHRFFVPAFGAPPAVRQMPAAVVLRFAFAALIVFFPFQFGQELKAGLPIRISFAELLKIYFSRHYPAMQHKNKNKKKKRVVML